jgi:hypothetical protein
MKLTCRGRIFAHLSGEPPDMSAVLPSLLTPRLALKALQKHQAETLFELANGPGIADNTAAIPSYGLLRADWRPAS